ncbi:MAG: hypothetical protein LBG94_06455 [Treponema sp.]|jgi:hypothetical protein|nr:hypothetical protein [Treponema sp.]
MDYEDFIRKLAFSKEMNPFHDSFSIENFKLFFEKYFNDKDSSSQLAFAFFILVSNPAYKYFYISLNNLFTKDNEPPQGKPCGIYLNLHDLP